MADNISIVMTMKTDIDARMKSIASTTQGCSKAFEEFQRRTTELKGKLGALEKNYSSLNQKSAAAAAEAAKLKLEMSAMTKAARASGEELDTVSYEKLRREYQRLSDVAKNFKSEAQDVRKEIRLTEDEARKMTFTEGEADGGKRSMISLAPEGSVWSFLSRSGVLKQGGEALSNLGGAIAGSALGDAGGSLVSSIGAGIASGAAGGAMFGHWGALIGAGIGVISGVVNGATQIFESQDDAFKAYVQDAYEGQISAQEASLANGSTLAAEQERDMASFTQLFKDRNAREYRDELVDIANGSSFLYSDLARMSKTLKEMDYGAGDILSLFHAVGGAGTALGLESGEMSTVVSTLGQLRSSEQASLENLNALNSYGIDAVEMLAEAAGVEREAVYGQIASGEISGEAAAAVIMDALKGISPTFEPQAQIFSSLSSMVDGLNAEMDTAMGEGYNDERKIGLANQRAWLSGDSGEAIMEANRAIGAWKAELENSKEQYIREATDAMMSSAEYQSAKAEGDAAEMGRLIMEARVQGMNEYNASEGAQLALKSERMLVETIRNDAGINEEYWNAGYERGKWLSLGLAAAQFNKVSEIFGFGIRFTDMGIVSTMTPEQEKRDQESIENLRNLGLLGFGLDYVPYDGFPALLHEGERVLTAEAARRMDRGGGVSVTVTGNAFHVRQASDIDEIAEALARKLRSAALRGGI